MAFDARALEILALLITIGLAAFAVVRLNRPRARMGDRARAVVRESGGVRPTLGATEAPSLKEQLSQTLVGLGNRLPLFNHKQRQQITILLRAAGQRHARALSLFIMVKVAAGGLGAFGGAFAIRAIPDPGFVLATIFVLGGLQVGLMVPEFLLHAWVKRRRRDIHRSLPDALDLLVICTNAGYSLAASITRISHEMRELSPALADELDLTAHDIRLSGDTVGALRSLAERTKVDSLRSVVATLIQAQQYGTPITQSLKTLAKSERNTRILLLEERGAKLAAKLTLPMMLLILPAVILISGAPAMMQLMETLK